MLAGTNSALMRSYNVRVVLELIRRSDHATRADIARETGLSLQGISTIFGHLEHEGWIVEQGRRNVRRGQRPVVYRLNAEGRGMIGIAIDLDGIRSVILDPYGRARERRETLLARPDPDEARRVVLEHVRDLEGSALERGCAVIGVGIAIPGTPDPQTNVVRTLPHIDGWDHVDLLAGLRSELSMPVQLANDATAAALGETWFGRHTGGTAFHVYFAHGLNGAVIEGRKPFGGIWGINGKFGHIPVVRNGRICSGCGGRGCLEAYASQLSLYDALGLPVEPGSASEVERRVAEGDDLVSAWAREAAEHLADALLSVENLFDPKSIVFGGRLPASLSVGLMKRAEKLVAPRRMKVKTEHPTYRTARFGSDAALIGAATLPLYLASAPDLDLVVARDSEVSMGTNVA